METSLTKTLRVEQLVKKAIFNERSRKGLGIYPDTRHGIPQFTVMMVAHNDLVGVILALTDYVETLKKRVEELENGRG